MNVLTHCPTRQNEYQSRNHRYQVNLVKLQAVCDANYLRLTKIAPDSLKNSPDTTSQIHLEFNGHKASATLNVLEQTRYTTLIQLFVTTPMHSWLPLPKLTVRMYHDVKMAEVIAADRHRYLNVRYEYPNTHMHQPDEKHQLNALLAEWLDHCMATGYLPDSVNI